MIVVMEACLSFFWALRLILSSHMIGLVVTAIHQPHALVPAFRSASHQIPFSPLIEYSLGVHPRKISVCREVDEKLRRGVGWQWLRQTWVAYETISNHERLLVCERCFCRSQRPFFTIPRRITQRQLSTTMTKRRPVDWKAAAPEPLPEAPDSISCSFQSYSLARKFQKLIIWSDLEYASAIKKITSFETGRGRELHNRLFFVRCCGPRAVPVHPVGRSTEKDSARFLSKWPLKHYGPIP